MDIRDRGLFGELHPVLKLLILGIIMLLSLFVVMVLGSLVLIPFISDDWFDSLARGFDFTGISDLNVLRYLQILSHIGLFIIPSLLFAWLIGGKISRYLGFDHRVGVGLLILSVLLILSAVPLINYLIELNMRMTLPESLSYLEEWMRRAEDNAMELTEKLLNVTTIRGLLFNIFMIAVIPAIGEEFLFRGIVLRVFRQWSKSIHIAVWVSAILFSAMHLQFYGFLPRLFLGALLGYLFAWSGSIWLPVFAHFINNAIAVTAYYLIYSNYLNVDYEELGKETTAFVYVVFSIIIVGFILYLFFRYYKNRVVPD